MNAQKLINTYTDRLIEEAKLSARKRLSLPTMAGSIEECNSVFRIFDSNLADTLEKLKKLISSKKIYRFSVNLIVNVSGNSKLRRKCCNCPSNPLGHHERNAERSKAERELKHWLEHAEKWVKNGRPEIKASSRFSISRNNKSSKTGRFKNKNFDY